MTGFCVNLEGHHGEGKFYEARGMSPSEIFIAGGKFRGCEGCLIVGVLWDLEFLDVQGLSVEGL